MRIFEKMRIFLLSIPKFFVTLKARNLRKQPFNISCL